MYLRGNTCSKQTTPSIYVQYIAVSSNTTILLSLYLLYLYIYNIFLYINVLGMNKKSDFFLVIFV